MESNPFDPKDGEEEAKPSREGEETLPTAGPDAGAPTAPSGTGHGGPTWQPLPPQGESDDGGGATGNGPAAAGYDNDVLDAGGVPPLGPPPGPVPGFGPGPAGGWTPPYAQPGYGGGGYGAAGTHGYAAGYGPGGYGSGGSPFGGPDDQSDRTKRHRAARVTALVVAALVLLIGVGTAGVFIGRNSNGRSRANEAIPQPSSHSASQTKLDVAAIAAKVDPATVDITSVISTENEEAEGTGMILTSNGEVLTNNHVIEDANKITAQVDGKGTTYTVKVIGADPTADVALVLLEGASGLKHVSIGNSSTLAVGDPVVAIGNALGLGGTPTVTSGIVSALDRSITANDSGTGASEHLTGLLQTDAPINPGNSGGPLVDSSGQVIGMDTAAAGGSGTETATNVGFAIPINTAISIATKIQEGKGSSTILIGTRGIIGVTVESVAEAEQPNFFGVSPTLPVNYGAVVASVLPGSPAADAGIAAGDVIVALDGKRVATDTNLHDMLLGDHAGKRVSVTWLTSSGARHTATLTLEAAPAL